MDDAITVLVSAHRPRVENGLLNRALISVANQTLQPARISLAIDVNRDGAAVTKQRALEGVTTPLVAVLDSDDHLDPEHLEVLLCGMRDHDADYVFSYFHGPDVLGHFGRPFDNASPHETTTTILIRTELALAVGFKALPDRIETSGEDFAMTLGCVALGAKIVHVPRRTWTYHMDAMSNTSGLGGNW